MKPTKKQVAEFVKLQQRLVIEAGFSLRHEDSLGTREYVKRTTAGNIFCTPFGDWVAVRFADVEAAKRAGIAPANDYSGKHNFTDVMTVDGASKLEAFLQLVKSDFSSSKPARAVIPRREGDTYDCTDCPWQGKFRDTDSGHCPDCGAEVISEQPVEGTSHA